MKLRTDLMQHWLTHVLSVPVITLNELSGDASARRYYRIYCDSKSYIVMDAPPEKLSCQSFLTVAALLKNLGVHVPEIIASNLDSGFLLLSDLGDQQYLLALDENNADALYDDALNTLLLLQTNYKDHSHKLPEYDQALLMRELEIFNEWVLNRYLQLSLSSAEQDSLSRIFELLCNNALEQPQVLVHRDYHSRNLMVTPFKNPGVLDFQDAVIGPLTYDLVSLLRDCYIDWPQEKIHHWVLHYLTRLENQGFKPMVDKATFLRWFDLTGIQRHLKAAGLFVRLKLRDGKAGFWQDIPRTLGYLIDTTAHYSELADLNKLIKAQLPKFTQ
jgi:aminoglycoside/choline kinase family phosphotransferase